MLSVADKLYLAQLKEFWYYGLIEIDLITADIHLL